MVKHRGNGQGTVYKRGKTWTCEVRMYAGTLCRRATKGGFPTKREAVAYLPTLQATLVDEPKPKTISFTDLWDKWTNTQVFLQLSPDKQDAYRIAWRKCTPLYALSDVRKCSYDSIANIIQGMTYYPARDVKRILNGMFELAMRMECAERNPAPLLQLPPIPQARKVTFTDEHVRLLEESSEEFAKVILLMIYMGLRPIEVRTMCVEDVHLDEHLTYGGRKTSSETPIAVPAKAEGLLRALCDKAGSGRLVNMSEDDFYQAFYKTLDSCGIQNESDHTITPVSCRHTFVTRLTRAGVPLALVQKASRHTSYKTTQGYTHIDIRDVLSVINL